MACMKKEKTGKCSHYQCPHSEETSHGYECVELFQSAHNGKRYCEAGFNCYSKCSYSFTDQRIDTFPECFTIEEKDSK